MSRQAGVFFRTRRAGTLSELSAGRYRFVYDPAHLASGPAISASLPLQAEPFESDELFPFFAGLVPEGWYLRIVAPTIKVDPDDTFGLLLHSCEDCIGAIGLRADQVGEDPCDAP